MSGISKGLDFLRQQQARQSQRDNREVIYKLWISSGDTAKYWMLVQDVDADMMAPMVHSEEKTVMKDGPRKGTKFTVDILCERETRDEPIENCQYCAEGVKLLGHRLICWVYAESITHETQKKPEWELAKKGNTKLYLETPDPRVRLLIMKNRLAQQVLKKYEENGSLFDRPYKLEKTGTGTSTLEILSCPDDAVPVPAEVTAAYNSLMPLEDAIRSEFGRFTKTARPQLGGRGIYTPAADDDDGSGLVDLEDL